MITETDVIEAYENIQPYVVNSQIRRSHMLSQLCGCDMLLKMENLQMSGAFKERGALNRLMHLSEEEKARGVIAASAGNHAQGVAYHAQRMGMRATIVMPEGTPLVKVTGVQFWGANVVLKGDTYDDAYAYSRMMEKAEGLTYIHPFADPVVIAGQGTIALEVFQNKLAAEADAVVVPVGGGGLIAGIGAYVKKTRPDVRVIGVEVDGFSSMKDSLAAGKVLTLPFSSTIADGIAVKQVSENTFGMCQKYVDEIVTVNDDEISNAILCLLEYDKVVVEGAGAVPVAALLNNKISGLEGKKVVSIVSGGNIDVNILARVIDRGLDFGGRIAQFSIRLKDCPGALEEVLSVFRQQTANVLEVYQHKYAEGVPVGQVNVTFTIETKNEKHITSIEKELLSIGFDIFQARWDRVTPNA